MAEELVTHQSLVCCLDRDDYRNRITWIENLTQRALRGHRRDDLKLHLTNAPEAVADVRLMVEQERTCCAFLTFALQQQPDAITVIITAPEVVRDSADVLFASFLAGRSSPDA
jgi:hypothetical protein